MPRQPMQFPEMPGKTPRERFENLARRVFSVPKAEIDRREAEYQKGRARKKRQKARAAAAVILSLCLVGSVCTLITGTTAIAAEGGQSELMQDICAAHADGAAHRVGLLLQRWEERYGSGAFPFCNDFDPCFGVCGDNDFWPAVPAGCKLARRSPDWCTQFATQADTEPNRPAMSKERMFALARCSGFLGDRANRVCEQFFRANLASEGNTLKWHIDSCNENPGSSGCPPHEGPLSQTDERIQKYVAACKFCPDCAPCREYHPVMPRLSPP